MSDLPLLKEGSSGSDVVKLQTLLNQKLNPTPALVADGRFGPRTTAAVKTFQQHHPWFQGHSAKDANGEVHRKTWAALGVKPAEETWREIVRFLDSHGVHHWPPNAHQTIGGDHANNSLHYAGVAVDLDPTVEIFKALEPFAKLSIERVLAELYLDMPGCGFYRHGNKCPPVPGHHNHCHASLEIGRHMPIIGIDINRPGTGGRTA